MRGLVIVIFSFLVGHGSARRITFTSKLQSAHPSVPNTSLDMVMVSGDAADDLINEFNDPNMGIAFSMIPRGDWELVGSATDKHQNGMDAAGFYPLSAVSEYHKDAQQAISIVTRVQDMNPYTGYGQDTYGLVFHITEGEEFWKYFQVYPAKDVLVAGPGDGGNHVPPNGHDRKTLPEMGKSYEWFTQQKNAVLAKYNTVYHIHDYNEFDTNGLSPTALAGVFDPFHKSGPSEETMCNFLKHKNPSKSKWPVYGYKWHNLYIKEYLNCAGGSVIPVAPPHPVPTPAKGGCDVSPRRDCGYSGVNQIECEQKGCCWKEGTPGSHEPWCFFKA